MQIRKQEKERFFAKKGVVSVELGAMSVTQNMVIAIDGPNGLDEPDGRQCELPISRCEMQGNPVLTREILCIIRLFRCAISSAFSPSCP